MHIVCFMTAIATLIFDRRMHIGLVTLIATQLPMFSSQWKIRLAVVEPAFSPTVVIVALLTLLTILAKMPIVMPVATDAGLRQVGSDGVRPMAGGALQCVMRAQQRKPGVLAMIKAGLLPAIRCMTTVTLIPH